MREIGQMVTDDWADAHYISYMFLDLIRFSSQCQSSVYPGILDPSGLEDLIGARGEVGMWVPCVSM